MFLPVALRTPAPSSSAGGGGKSRLAQAQADGGRGPGSPKRKQRAAGKPAVVRCARVQHDVLCLLGISGGAQGSAYAAGILVCDELQILRASASERLRSQVWDKPEVIGQLLTAAPTARILEEVAREGQGAG